MKKFLLVAAAAILSVTTTPAFARHSDGYYESANNVSGWENVSNPDYQMARYGRTYSTYYDRAPGAVTQASEQNDVSCTSVLIFYSKCSSHPRVVCYDANGQLVTVDQDNRGNAVANTGPMRRAPAQVSTSCGGNSFSASGGEDIQPAQYSGATSTTDVINGVAVTVTINPDGTKTVKTVP